MVNSRATLCIDAGTTLIKAVVFDASGHELVVASRPTTVASPMPGFAEQDMMSVWRAVIESAREAVERSPHPIERISVTAQGDGAWLLGRDGRPVRPAILWNDARSREVIARWRDDGTLDRAFAINGSLSNLGLPNAILSTLIADDPEALDRVDSVLTCGSWLFYQLTGVVGLHPSEASAPWLDVSRGEYSPELLDLYGLSSNRDLLPPVLDDSSVASTLDIDAATALGLPRGIPVVLAPYDVVATAAGGGTVDAGSAFCILGTTLCTGVVVDRPDTTGTPSGLTLRIADDGPFVRAFPTLAGTGVIEWMARIVGAADAPDLVRLAALAPPGSAGLTVWPYFSPAGERAPFLDEDARGVIAGLSFEHSREHLARASVEGLAHVVRDCLAAAPETPVMLTLSGGGAGSDLWCETLADVTGVTTVRTGDSQIGAKGALIYAAVATGEFDSVGAAARELVVTTERFEPHAELRSMYDSRHTDFVASRAAFQPRWATWAAHGRG
ncbi:FGGY family carbohydrate kinase [Agreia sp.]|uniref:FGGY family carbohydrate kinase n=1 Tax=Agreia sp. TaxID=1872416 RepID=UPI0035BBA436